MTKNELLRRSFTSLEVNTAYSEATLVMSDSSRLCFCHRVGERWAKAIGVGEPDQVAGLAGTLLSSIAMFRLNAKHLDIQFDDGSRWEIRFNRG